jgi:LAO/AO transport system kinase
MSDELQELYSAAMAGDPRALARLITAVEDGADGVLAVLGDEPPAGRVHVLGITGPPGSGKSTLVDRLVTRFRAAGESVAVLLVDPSSPFSGGAVLGDRIRMQHHTTDAGVFIRSLGSRGHQGGMTRATDQVLHLLRSAPFDRVVVETVGVGQTELQIMDLADTVTVVLVPEAGDSIQAMKAGLMEIAHVFAVNKADRPGADRLALELSQSLHHAAAAAAADDAWGVRVVTLAALHDQGVDDLDEAIEAHREHRTRHPRAGRMPRQRLADVLEVRLQRRLVSSLEDSPGAVRELLEQLDSGQTTVYRAAERILASDELLSALLGPRTVE